MPPGDPGNISSAHFRNAFADTPSNALDVIYSIPAARHAVPQLGSRWIAMGNGEGGAAVVAVAELEHEIQDPLRHLENQ